MRIFHKIINIVLIILVFLGGMFFNINSSNNTGFLGFETKIIQTANAQQQIDCNQAANKSKKECNPEAGKSNALNGIIDALNAILSILIIIVSPIILLAWWLMSPDWVTGDIFGLREKMHLLWITVSNVLYFVYAIMLIIIAIATIFNYQPYAYKSMLPRLFIGIILIPLTWWFVQFVISTATTVTGTVLKIPQEMMEKVVNNDNSKTFWTQNNIPKVMTFGDNASKNEAETKKCKDQPGECTSPESILKSWLGIYSPIFIYAYGVFELHNIQKLPDGSSIADVINTVGSLANQLIFNTILFFIFWLLTIALVFILLIRAIKLWMYAIFSPIFTAKIVFKDWKWDGSEMFDIKEFIGLAFVPAVIGLALSFGLIVISALKTWNTTSTTCDMTQQECVLMTIGGNPNNKITSSISGTGVNPNGTTTSTGTSVTTVQFWELKFRYEWSLNPNSPANVKDGWFIGGFGTIIVQVIALIFIWVAFIAASKISKWVQTIIAPFEEFGKWVASMGKESVKMIPLPWVGNVGGLQQAQTYLRTAQQTRTNNAFAGSKVWQFFDAPFKDIKVEAQINKALNVDIKWWGQQSSLPTWDINIIKNAVEEIKTNDGYSNKNKRLELIRMIEWLTSGNDIKIEDIKKLLVSWFNFHGDSFSGLWNDRNQILATLKTLTDEQVIRLANGESLSSVRWRRPEDWNNNQDDNQNNNQDNNQE